MSKMSAQLRASPKPELCRLAQNFTHPHMKHQDLTIHERIQVLVLAVRTLESANVPSLYDWQMKSQNKIYLFIYLKIEMPSSVYAGLSGALQI